MRNIIKLALAGLLSVSTFAVAAESSPEALRIGYQKGSIGMVLAKKPPVTGKTLSAIKNLLGGVPRGSANVGSVKRWQY